MLNQTIDLIELIGILWRKKGTLFLFAIAIAIVSFLVSLALPKKYDAHTSIIIAENPRTRAMSGWSTTAFGMAGFNLPTEVTASYNEILKSRRIFFEVIKENNLRNYYGYPEDSSKDLKLMREITKKLNVSPIRDNVLHIYFEDRNPEMASRVANSFIQNLRVFLESSTLSTSENAKNFIEEQINQVKFELEQAEEALKKFMAENEAAGIDEQVLQAVRQASTIEAERNAAKIQLSLVRQNIKQEKNRKDEFDQKYYDYMEKYPKSEGWNNVLAPPSKTPSDLSNLPDEFLTDNAILELRSKLTELKIKLLEEKITKTEKHPSVVKVNDEILKIRGLFIKEVENVLDSRLASLEFERINLAAEVAAYDSVMSDFEKSWESLPEKSTQYVRFKRDVEALSEVYLLLKNQLAETKIDVAHEKRYFEVLDVAVPPDKPKSPKIITNTVVGLVLGFVIGALWVYVGALMELRKRGLIDE